MKAIVGEYVEDINHISWLPRDLVREIIRGTTFEFEIARTHAIIDEAHATPERKFHIKRMIQVSPNKAYTAMMIYRNCIAPGGFDAFYYSIMAGSQALLDGRLFDRWNYWVAMEKGGNLAKIMVPLGPPPLEKQDIGRLAGKVPRLSRLGSKSADPGYRDEKRIIYKTEMRIQWSDWVSESGHEVKFRPDRRMCEVSGQRTPLVRNVSLIRTHIIPILPETQMADHFWFLLKCFWMSEDVEELQEYLEVSGESNFINMRGGVHDDFCNGYFNLIPKWDTMTPTSYEAVFQNTHPGEIWVPNCWKCGTRDPQWLQDGDIIKFETWDRISHPLPNPVFLYIRSILTQCIISNGSGEEEFPISSCPKVSSKVQREQPGLFPVGEGNMAFQIGPRAANFSKSYLASWLSSYWVRDQNDFVDPEKPPSEGDNS